MQILKKRARSRLPNSPN